MADRNETGISPMVYHGVTFSAQRRFWGFHGVLANDNGEEINIKGEDLNEIEESKE